jgi:CRP/FNR family cyclic AMP-dependent transcriptional regulator
MSLESLRENARLLDGLSAEALEFLESVAREVFFPKGAVIFDEDEKADSFYLIATGKVGLEVALPARDPVLLETLGPGELLGVSWLVPPHRWSWKARALAATDILAFDAEAVRAQCRKDLDLALHVYRTVAEESIRRLHATRVRLLDLYPGAGE